jgi:hypothetical protein
VSKLRLLAAWFFDWWVLPLWEAVQSLRGGKKDDGKQEAPDQEPPRG